MSHRQHTWALVLAAGEGSRLHSLTTDATGTAIPKQFCSLHGGTSLLLDTLRRAHSVAPRDRICAVVAEAHRRWWHSDLWSLDCANVVVQPANRGTANGILLPLLSILAQDPFAKVVFLPSDHYFAEEAVIARALKRAVDQVYARPDSLALLGIEPDEARVLICAVRWPRVSGPAVMWCGSNRTLGAMCAGRCGPRSISMAA